VIDEEMEITPHNILQNELIGLKAEVEVSTNRYMKGLRGTVVDETRNMLIMENEEREEKMIVKAGNILIFELESGVRVRVKGDRLVSRAEDRIKK
jgi:ribonuclease P protein subunit POP4